MTVVDQVRPWLIPSRTLAATTIHQSGAQIEQQWDGYGDEPARDQDRLATVALGPGTGQVVGERLGQAEGEDVGQCRGVGVQAEHVGGQQGQDGAFLAEHAAHQGVDRDQKRELGGVRAQPQDGGR